MLQGPLHFPGWPWWLQWAVDVEQHLPSSMHHPTAWQHMFLWLKMHVINCGWGPSSHVFSILSVLTVWLEWMYELPLQLAVAPKLEWHNLTRSFLLSHLCSIPAAAASRTWCPMTVTTSYGVCSLCMSSCHLSQKSLLASARSVFERQASVLLARTHFSI